MPSDLYKLTRAALLVGSIVCRSVDAPDFSVTLILLCPYPINGKRIKAQKYRDDIKADPIKYTAYLANTKIQNANSRRRRTPEQNREIILRTKTWVLNNKDRHRDTQTKWRRKARLQVLEKYGRICACCKESHIEFLAIDHIGGGGGKHRKELGGNVNFMYWLRKNNFPKGFRVLCNNCNQSLGHYGYCPHNNL